MCRSFYRVLTIFTLSVFLPLGMLAQDEEKVGAEPPLKESKSLATILDEALQTANGYLAETLFVDVSGGLFESPKIDRITGKPILDDKGNPVMGGQMPFLVVLLAGGALFFTFYHRFINIRGFKHSIDIVRGKHSDQSETGEITPFRALTSALSATVGLGNIASVAVAILLGGPGALFWMVALGFFGMTLKFHESTLAQMYRVRNQDGTIFGGPMFYLSTGLKEMGSNWAVLGRVLAIFFAVACMFGALGAGNMFQANQAFEGFFKTFIMEGLEGSTAEEIAQSKRTIGYGFGLVLSAIIAVVVMGGITRIGAATSRIVPFMAALYIGACITIIGINIGEIPSVIKLVFVEAFNWDSFHGGLFGVIIIGFQRAVFSSEAGLGSSAIAHSSAKTDIPVKEGFVASLEPFIDTVVICCMTALVILVSGAYAVPELQGKGAEATLYAFEQNIGFFEYVLAVCIILFAFSTMLSWCYYGERAWGYLFGVNSAWFGLKSIVYFRMIFVVVVFMGTVMELNTVINFADMVLLSMALPNLIGGIILAPKVKKQLDQYWAAIKAGEKPKIKPDNYQI